MKSSPRHSGKCTRGEAHIVGCGPSSTTEKRPWTWPHRGSSPFVATTIAGCRLRDISSTSSPSLRCSKEERLAGDLSPTSSRSSEVEHLAGAEARVVSGRRGMVHGDCDATAPGGVRHGPRHGRNTVAVGGHRNHLSLSLTHTQNSNFRSPTHISLTNIDRLASRLVYTPAHSCFHYLVHVSLALLVSM